MKYLHIALIFLLFLSCQKNYQPGNSYEDENLGKTEMKTILYIDRASQETKTENVPGEGMLKWLYSSATGKAALNLLVKRKIISSLGGWYMNTKLSAKRIPDFVKEHHINLAECNPSSISDFSTFNHFFYRKLQSGARAIGKNVVSPADGKILVFQSLADVSSFFVKGSEFTLQRFLQDEELAKKYADGAMAIVRLAPADYHRYHFPAAGKVSTSLPVKGFYYSVSQLALRGSLRIFCENQREYCQLKTKKYGDILLSEIGATMVGSIIQTYKANSEIKKGEEKGYFAFGGSTLVLLFEKGKITFDPDLISNTKKGLETSIQVGENIAQ